MNNGELFYPAQKMSRSEAIKSYTINNAYAAFEESEKGSLEVGKLADIAFYQITYLILVTIVCRRSKLK